MESNLIKPGDNLDITLERKKATFDVDQMAAFIHGGVKIVKRRHEILKTVETIPEFVEKVPLEFLNRQERHEEQARRAVAMTDFAMDIIDGSDFFGEGMYYQRYILVLFIIKKI